MFNGILACLAVSVIAWVLQTAEIAIFGRAWLEALVLAILVGAAVRTAAPNTQSWSRGIAFCAHTLLEVAVVLLGAAVSITALLGQGWHLLAAIAGLVAVAICVSYAIGRALRLPHRMALLVACGNAICGNSAIAAVAPVIGASGVEVAAAIGFTAVFGVAVVLALPLAVPLLHLSLAHYGTLAGLTVYAVPQVLAATGSAGAVATQVGTLVKLVRVLMLGPVVFTLSLLTPGATGARPRLHQMVPWFILGFAGLLAARAAGAIPQAALAPIGTAATTLTIVSMAGLGLGTDLRAVGHAGWRVSLTVILSLATLAAGALALIGTLA